MEIKSFLSFVLVGCVLWSPAAQAAMSSASYEILWDTVNNGGDDFSASASYTLRDSVGNQAIGDATSSNYLLRGGYRSGVNDQTIAFNLFSQKTTSASALAVSGTTIDVSTSVDFSTGDYIALVQDVEGAVPQTTAVGKIVSKTSDTLTVDQWADGGVAPVIDGTDDIVYLLQGSSVAFSSLSDAHLTERLIAWEVTAEAENGYTVQVVADDGLRSTSHTMTDVADGTVSIGVEEYGARSSDSSISTSTFDTQDTAIGADFAAVGQVTEATYHARQFLTLKSSISSDTESGSYAQVLTFIATANY